MSTKVTSGLLAVSPRKGMPSTHTWHSKTLKMLKRHGNHSIVTTGSSEKLFQAHQCVLSFPFPIGTPQVWQPSAAWRLQLNWLLWTSLPPSPHRQGQKEAREHIQSQSRVLCRIGRREPQRKGYQDRDFKEKMCAKLSERQPSSLPLACEFYHAPTPHREPWLGQHRIHLQKVKVTLLAVPPHKAMGM